MSQAHKDNPVRKPGSSGKDGPAEVAGEICLIGTAAVPGGGELQLLRCGDDFSIQLGDEELMGSTDHVSEEALATLAAHRLSDLDGTVLIGGLGMGYTLGAALDTWGAGAGIVVAELIPEVLAWAQGPLAHLFGNKLVDPRVSVTVADVYGVIVAADELFDAILLDVDNGPEAFVQHANDRLYSRSGLRAAYTALRPGGVLGVWSSYADRQFSQDLQLAGFTVDEVTLPAYEGAEVEWHSLWFARKETTAALAS